MRVVYMGSPDFAVAPLYYLVQEGYRVAAVYTKMDKPAGRGQALSVSLVKQAALALNLTIVQPKSLKSNEVQAELAALRPELIIVCAYGQIIPPVVLNLPQHGCLNIHPSLLPRHRGASPVTATILAGDAWSGTSIMRMDEGLDTGPVLTRAQIPVKPDDTASSLLSRLSLISAGLLTDVLPRWVRGEISPRPQDASQVTYFKPLSREAGEIDWRLPALEIWRRVRAFEPWPGTYTRFQGKLLKILEARPLPLDAVGSPGCVTTLGGALAVITGAGVLELLRVQLEGKQAVSAAEFARGQRNLIGTVLASPRPSWQ